MVVGQKKKKTTENRAGLTSLRESKLNLWEYTRM